MNNVLLFSWLPTEMMVGMDFGWGPDNYAATYSTPDLAHTVSTPLSGGDRNSSFADGMSAFANQEPIDDRQNSAASTVDPMNMSSVPDQSSTASSLSRHDSAQAGSAPPNTIPADSPETPYEEVIPLHMESESTCRARYAANQRHNKTRNSLRASHQTSNTNKASTEAEEKKRKLREKNKVAAAKCRQRQRKQVETIRAKGSRLSETNMLLESYVQELRGELNGLRALALGHSGCDDRLARYNHVQAEKVLDQYYSACSGLAGAMVTSEQTKRQGL